MKRISTVGMESEEKRQVRGNLLGGIGNDNIRGAHIKYFEEKLIEEKEFLRDGVSSAPNYYAWLSLTAEHVFWRMRHFCYRNSELEHDNLALMYNDLIFRFCDGCRELGLFSDDELRSLFELAVKVLELRHALVHRGFPNLLPIMYTEKNVRNMPKFNKDEENVKFTEHSSRQTTDWYSNPQNFNSIKEEFDRLRQAMSKGPGLSVGF